MIRSLCSTALAIATLLSSPAWAGDSRLVERMFDPDEVVRIDGRPNVQATIRFAEDEHIENVAVGDSNAWQVTPNKRANLLFVKPLSARAATNMTVVTDQHTYLFDLVAGSAQHSPLYVLSFAYPKVEKAAEPAVLALAEPVVVAPLQLAVVKAPALLAPPTGANVAWRTKGAAELLPQRVFDDGHSTFLQWGQDATMPAILIRNAWGVEGPVNYAVRDGAIVVDGVPRELILRSGKSVANLINDGPHKAKSKARPATLAQADPVETR